MGCRIENTMNATTPPACPFCSMTGERIIARTELAVAIRDGRISEVKGNHDVGIEDIAFEGVHIHPPSGFAAEEVGFVHGHVGWDAVEDLAEGDHLAQGQRAVDHHAPAVPDDQHGGQRLQAKQPCPPKVNCSPVGSICALRFGMGNG